MYQKEIVNLNELNRKAVAEICRYKWLESEKLGYDIGEFRAAREWIVKYYTDWLENQKYF